MSSYSFPPPLGSEEEIQNTVQEWQSKYSNVERTTKMLQTLRETHDNGVDSLMKLSAQGEQMGRIEKLALENEQHLKGLGKYKKFQKYMKKVNVPVKENKPKEINHEVQSVKSRHSANEKIYKNREERKIREAEEKRLKDIKELNENKDNPFSEGNNLGSQPRTRKEPEENGSGGGLSSRMWGGGSDNKSKAEASMVNMRPITTPNEEDLKDNVYIQKATWLQIEDEQLDEMQMILGDLKNIAIAQHTEVQQQSQKMDDIKDSFERGSDFNLKRKSPKQIEKEKKKAEKEEKKKLKEEMKRQKNLGVKIETNIGHKPITKDQLVSGQKPNEVGNPFL